MVGYLERLTSVAKMITFKNGVQWYPPLSAPHSPHQLTPRFQIQPFFCSIIHTPADPRVAAPGMQQVLSNQADSRLPH